MFQLRKIPEGRNLFYSFLVHVKESPGHGTDLCLCLTYTITPEAFHPVKCQMGPGPMDQVLRKLNSEHPGAFARPTPQTEKIGGCLSSLLQCKVTLFPEKPTNSSSRKILVGSMDRVCRKKVGVGGGRSASLLGH